MGRAGAACSCGEGRCVAATAGDRRIGNECDSDADCATLDCADLGDASGRVCATPCPAGGGRGCPDGTICHATTSGCGACVRPAGAGGAFGTGCSADADCASALCYAPGPTGVCTVPCGEGGRCAPGFECDGELCAPAGAQLGETCRSKTDCATSMCGHAADGVGLCTRTCTTDDDCGDGFRCRQHGRRDRRVLARGGQCSAQKRMRHCGPGHY